MENPSLRDKRRKRFSQSACIWKSAKGCFRDQAGRKKTNSLSVPALVLLLLVCVPAADAKGKPDKIAIRGGKFPRPIEITDREILQGFDPWTGQFIDWPRGIAAKPPNWQHAFEVFFYQKKPGTPSRYDQGDLKLIYALTYYPGYNGAPGYIYLPGKGQAFYSLNTGTMTRQGHDGEWHYASPAWEALMKRAFTRTEPPPAL
jgi:hypothetical protein